MVDPFTAVFLVLVTVNCSSLLTHAHLCSLNWKDNFKDFVLVSLCAKYLILLIFSVKMNLLGFSLIKAP